MFLLTLRSILFAFLLPGTFTILVPYWIVSRGSGHAPEAFWHYCGLLPMAAGASILIWCIRDFAVIGRGTLAPVDPPKHLVVHGLYRYVRNPMYVGVLTILLGEAGLFGSWGIIREVAIFFCVVHLFIVFYEEPTLRRQFDGSYEEYCRRVHRWVPTVGKKAKF
jgi:protein-S-isoprenylcysteine O-methyltransferase Ste14